IDFEIGRILHLTSKSEISDWTLSPQAVQFALSNFGFEIRDSSNFEMSSSDLYLCPLKHCASLSTATPSFTARCLRQSAGGSSSRKVLERTISRSRESAISTKCFATAKSTSCRRRSPQVGTRYPEAFAI